MGEEEANTDLLNKFIGKTIHMASFNLSRYLVMGRISGRMISVVEPEPDFFAGDLEKALAPGCCCVA